MRSMVEGHVPQAQRYRRGARPPPGGWGRGGGAFSPRDSGVGVRLATMHVGVVGHVEWIEFARVPEVPGPGAIVHASEVWEEPGGGGAVAAVQLAKLAGR